MAPFKIVEADGTEWHIQGYESESPDAGATRFDRENANLAELPAKVDMREFLPPVRNQGQTSSCVANATAGAYEYLVQRHRGSADPVSRLFLYYNARYLANPDDIEDKGSRISMAIEGLKQYGACLEDTWPFEPEYVNEEPVKDAYDQAAAFLVEDVKHVPRELESWKTALATGHCIIFGIHVYPSFSKHPKPGLVPVPSQSELSAGGGGHVMLGVGYSDTDQVFIVRNSWGEQWGDKGYCYIPYRYVFDVKQEDEGDCWIINRLDSLPPDENTWSNDNESVLEDVSTILATLSEDEFEAFLEAMGEHPFEKRLGLIFLAGVGADGEISNDEIEGVTHYLTPVLEQTGGHQNVAGILKFARQHLDDEDLISESIDLLGQFFPKQVLASITLQIQDAASASASGLSKEDAAFVDDLIARWQVDAGEQGKVTTPKKVTTKKQEDNEEEEEEIEEEDEEEEEDEDE